MKHFITLLKPVALCGTQKKMLGKMSKLLFSIHWKWMVTMTVKLKFHSITPSYCFRRHGSYYGL